MAGLKSRKQRAEGAEHAWAVTEAQLCTPDDAWVNLFMARRIEAVRRRLRRKVVTELKLLAVLERRRLALRQAG